LHNTLSMGNKKKKGGAVGKRKKKGSTTINTGQITRNFSPIKSSFRKGRSLRGGPREVNKKKTINYARPLGREKNLTPGGGKKMPSL